MEDMNLRVEFQPHSGFQSLFYEKCDEWANDYLKAKVFWTGELPKDTPKDILTAPSIYEFLYERIYEYLCSHKEHLFILEWESERIHPPCDKCETSPHYIGGEDGALCRKCNEEIDKEIEAEEEAERKKKSSEMWAQFLSEGAGVKLEQYDMRKRFDLIQAFCDQSPHHRAFFNFHKMMTAPVFGEWNWDKEKAKEGEFLASLA